MRSARRSLFVTLAMSAVFGTSGLAHANDVATAEKLFSDAKKLARAENWKEACPKFEESQRADPGVGTEFNLAECNEHIGKTASAWAQYLEVAALSRAAGQLAREEAARARAKALESKLLYVVVQVRGGEAGLEVSRDDLLVGRAQWGTPVPVDAGEHVVRAKAPGKLPWETRLRVAADAAVRTSVVTVPALENAPASAAPVVVAAPVKAPTPTEPPLQIERDTNTRFIVGAVVVGIGVAGLGVGSAFALMSKKDHDDGLAHCAGTVCDAEGVSFREDARREGNISTAAFIVGGAAVASGVVVWLTAPNGPKRSGVRAAPMFGVNGTGASVVGSW